MKTLTLSLLTIAAASSLFAQGNGYSTNYHQEAFTRCLSEVRYSGTDRYRAYDAAMPQVSQDAKLWVKGVASLGSALAQVGIERTDNQLYNFCMQPANLAAAAQLNANETGVPDLPRIMLFPGRWVAPRMGATKDSSAPSCHG